MNKLLPAFTAILFTLSARASRAEAEQPVPPKAKEAFGEAGHVVIGGDFSFSFRRYQMTNDSSLTSWGVNPSLDYFVVDHLSIGSLVGITRSTWRWFGNETSQTMVSAAPRIGYEVPLGDAVSLWPTAGIGYDREVAEGPHPSDPNWALDGYVRASLIAHVAKHFFVGGGPAFSVNLAHSPAVLAGSGVSFNSTLGGWI
jgi:hypothetical protein